MTIMKIDKKNRRNKNSMTQDYDYNQIDDINDDSLVTKMMTSNENNDQYGINSNENNIGNDTDDGIVSIIRIIMISIMTDKITTIIRRMIMIGMT